MNQGILVILMLVSAWTTVQAAPQAQHENQGKMAQAARTLDLDELLDIAMARNPDLKAATERIGTAEAQVTEAAAAFYPKVTGRVGYDYTSNPSLAFSYIVAQRRFSPQEITDNKINYPGYVSNFRPELIGTYTLFRGGQDYYRKKAAELGVEAATLEHSALKNRLVAAVSAAYYALLSAPQQLDVARRALAAVSSEVVNAHAGQQAGTQLKSDVLSLRVRESEARERELQALHAVTLSRAGLKMAIGMNQDESLEIRADAASDVGNDPLARMTVEELMLQAVAERPEMQAAARQVEIREKELLAEKGGHLPRVNAYTAYGLNEATPEFNFGKENLTMGINAEIDLFAGGAVQARIDGAERRMAEAEAARQHMRLEIENEVQQAHAALQEAEQRIDVADAASTAAAEALRLVHEQYRNDAVTVTRYLEAESDWAQAQTRTLLARFETQISLANLHKATGLISHKAAQADAARAHP